jgi:crotonobetainyl-CoA:carnitine CoA-transferase CaiB-like acyl-CoA transferase
MDRVANVDALEADLQAVIARLPREEAITKLSRAGIACGRLSDLDDLVGHPQRRTVTVDTEAGPVELLAPGARFPGEPEALGPVPALGQHGASVRAEFGSREKRSAS